MYLSWKYIYGHCFIIIPMSYLILYIYIYIYKKHIHICIYIIYVSFHCIFLSSHFGVWISIRRFDSVQVTDPATLPSKLRNIPHRELNRTIELKCIELKCTKSLDEIESSSLCGSSNWIELLNWIVEKKMKITGTYHRCI